MYNIRNRDPSMVKLSHTSLSSTSHVTIDKQTKNVACSTKHALPSWEHISTITMFTWFKYPNEMEK